ncbi:hypothetical protein [Luteipulveratus mongoliensis]|uniref:Secreted protein n=1 Tax=Luteipulveratus mongoliensis TaxID=571913 RepID=A0A0K1JNX8_9MICO|nr:hypothetical protein [Luteipulveratus mongoliensis]AKU18422.1 hypothetical protein VV02_25515 [Luteipulveratus mongoliensis]
MHRRTASLSIAAATLALGGALAGAPSASAGVYTWHHEADYSSSAECNSAGQAAIGGDYVKYECRGTSATELWLAEIW